MQITSTAFQAGADIPKQHTGDGADKSPALKWTDVPDGTQAFALICDDPDAPRGTWVHWVLFDILADTMSLAEGIAGAGVDGSNDFGKLGYGGPSPPRGKPHRYFFKLYAMDTPLKLAKGATKAQV